MVVKRKCAVCSCEFSYDNSVVYNVFTKPNSDGARYYYDLWHFPVETCPKCGYSSQDISKTQNVYIVEDAEYKSIANNKIVKQLVAARPNMLADYLKASLYYRSIGDEIKDAICCLAANDIIYGELIYWEEYIFDNNNTVTTVQNQKTAKEFTVLADELFNYAISTIKDYLKYNTGDYDILILLSGTLCDGSKIQKIEGVRLLNKLKTLKGLTKEQKLAVKFLIETLGI